MSYYNRLFTVVKDMMLVNYQDLMIFQYVEGSTDDKENSFKVCSDKFSISESDVIDSIWRTKGILDRVNDKMNWYASVDHSSVPESLPIKQII